MQLQGKTALIAGAGRNNGKAIALTYAREGADVILVAKTRGDDLNQVAKECEALGVKALPLLADVGKHEEVNRVVRLGLERFGKVDALVCATGIRPHKLFWDYSYEEWQEVFAVNLHSTFFFAKALAPSMIRRKTGNIIAIGSVASLAARPTAAVEVASKHGLYGIIKSLALELGPHGVRANLLAIAFIENERLHPEWYPNPDGTLKDKHSEAYLSAERANTPLRRIGQPQEVANVALFLASEQSSYITGAGIVCAGGRYM